MKQHKKILFITSYPPRQCGIATFTQDLLMAIQHKFSDSFSLAVCALSEGKEEFTYPGEVQYILDTSDLNNYKVMAEKINSDANIALVCIEHEFGLFTGLHGDHLLHLLGHLNKPVITTFHTILPQPDEKRKSVIKSIADFSEMVIVLTNHSAGILKSDYLVRADKIMVIPHGTHLVPWYDKDEMKSKYQLDGKFLLTTFGLLSNNKNIETVIVALPEITKQFPNVMYLILGKTHPGVLKNEGEQYRTFLEQKVKDLKLENNVLFVNRYLLLSELLQYLAATDIYIFTSKDVNQAVSGTFAYAMASGCPVIATKIPHAKELLAENSGILVDFENSKQVAGAAIKLLSNETLRDEMSRNALHQIRKSAWGNIAVNYAELFKKYSDDTFALNYNLPEISLQHINALTTPVGLIQFSNFAMPDLNSGYTIDDNARSLIVLSKLYELNGDKSLYPKINTYLDFIEFCQQDDGRFLNYVDQNKTFSQQNHSDNLQDSNGRTIWALGVFLSGSPHLHDYFIAKAHSIFEKTLDWVSELTSPRAVSFAIKGLYQYNNIYESQQVKNIIQKLAKRLVNNYYDNFDHQWKWFEPYLTYANSALPEAMLYAHLNWGDPMQKIIAKDSFDFLLTKIFSEHQIKVVSNNGWHHRNGSPNQFGEQPIDVAYTILALQHFYEVFKEEKYKSLMHIAFSWFLGNNHLKQTIYNPATGGCCDGLEENNVNLNQGAESTACYLMARIAMEELKRKNLPMESESASTMSRVKMKKVVPSRKG